MAKLLQAAAAALALVVAAVSGTNAVGVNWMPASDRFGDGDASFGEIVSGIAEAILVIAAMVFGLFLLAWIDEKARETGRDMLSFLRSCFRRR